MNIEHGRPAHQALETELPVSDIQNELTELTDEEFEVGDVIWIVPRE